MSMDKMNMRFELGDKVTVDMREVPPGGLLWTIFKDRVLTIVQVDHKKRMYRFDGSDQWFYGWRFNRAKKGFIEFLDEDLFLV